MVHSILDSEVTTTNQVFDMIDTHDGDYAGEFQNEAITALFGDNDYMWVDESWADFIIGKNSKLYAVKADGALTEFGTNAIIAEVPDYEWGNIHKKASEKMQHL